MKPTRKVTGAGIGGAVATLIIALTGWHPEPDAAAALATVCSFALGWVIRE